MSYSAMDPEGVAARPAVRASSEARLTFIRNVYLLMFSGVIVYALASALPFLGFLAEVPVLTGVFLFFVQLPPLVAFLLILGGSWVAHAFSMHRGINLLVFYGFAILFGLLSLPLVAIAAAVGGFAIFVQALLITNVIFGGLTMYVFITRKDFSFMGGFLTVGLFLLIGAVLASIIASMLGFDVSLISTALSLLAALLFSCYVLYDTSNLLHRYATDMVVPAALALLIDFIIIFRSILYLLVVARR